jgi:hypothetical protein
MTNQQRRGSDSAVAVIAVTLACATVGLIGLPILFGVSLATIAWSTPLWLVTGVMLATTILVVLPRLAPGLSTALFQQTTAARASVGPSVTPSQTLLLSRLVLLSIGVVITQAIVRRPVALLLTAERSASPGEAAVAAVAVAVLLALLVWLYQTGRPIMQSLTLRAIDAAVPTMSAAPLAQPIRTLSPVTPLSEDALALRGTGPPEATVLAGGLKELTIASPQPDELTRQALTGAEPIPVSPPRGTESKHVKPGAEATPVIRTRHEPTVPFTGERR